MQNISLLLGAGFSMPAGFPSASVVNERVKLTRNEDFVIGSNGTVDYRRNPKFITHSPYSYRYNELLSAITYYEIKEGNIDYEEFYDYLAHEIKDDVGFKKYYESAYDSQKIDGQFLTDLYSQILEKYIVSDNKTNTLKKYNAFIKWIYTSVKDGKMIHIHTLNHDLLLEDLLGRENISDGFILDDSSYYIEHHQQKISLQQFKDSYTKDIRLYKLHGSFDQYVCVDEGICDSVKISKGYNYTRIWDIYGRHFMDNYHPDFLTGKTAKKKEYNKPLYSTLLCHFETNVSNSDVFVIIGYGGKDEGINEIIKRRPGKMAIISPSINDDFIVEMRNAHWEVDIIKKGIESVTMEDFKNIVL